jgi:adenosine deaminase
LIRRSRAENIRYLELRCSPLNYTRAGLSAEEVVQIIDRELSAQDDFEYSLIFIASRHGKMSTVYQHVELAEELLEQDEVPSLRGFDLAGSEKTGSIEQLRQAFMPMLRQCRHITIHAGETEQVDRIWEAVYHLSAERIGHGLTLKDNTDLMEKFKDRNIAVEMCPSSNFQIVGFQDNYYPETRNQPAYPLQDYLEKGLKVAVCTDNPGISRTDFTNELHRAARLSLGGLSHWDICQILRNSFKSGFAPRGVRNRLLRNAEEELIDLLKQLDF